MQLRFKVPAKLILFGEHAVLEGARGIAVAISLWGKGTSTINEASFSETGDLEIFRNGERLHLAVDAPPGTSTRIDIPFSLGCGLGSSAVLSIIKALLSICSDGRVPDKALISEKAHQEERKLCPRVSGIDHNTLIEGGVVAYTVAGLRAERLDTSLFRDNKIILWYSGIEKSTKREVEKVGNVEGKEEIMRSISDVCERAYIEMKREVPSLQTIHGLMRENQELLSLLGICPEVMRKEIEEMRSLGVEAKISGAGGGGHLFSIVPRDFRAREGWFECDIDFHGLEFALSK
jgi:mevalonate kinase